MAVRDLNPETTAVIHAEVQDETSPLLSTPARDQKLPSHPHFVRVATVVIFSVFVLEIGDYMARTPIQRMLEDIVCRTYYESINSVDLNFDLGLPIPEDKCKIPPVQREMATLNGWDMTFQNIPGLIMSVPYAVLSDKYGRKLVWGLVGLGILMSSLWCIMIGK
jgi:MFS family permease